MELDNWEKRIQDIQQKKEATPSLDTRNKLDDLLVNDAKRAKKNQKIWRSAAAIALLLLVGSVSFWQLNTTTKTPEEVVNVPKKDTILPVIIQNKKLEAPVEVIVQNELEANSYSKEKFVEKEIQTEIADKYIDFPKQDSVVASVEATEEVLAESMKLVVVDTVFKYDQQQTKEYVSAADLLAWANGEKPEDSLFRFTDNEKMYVASDSLLRASQKEIFEEKNGDIFQRLGKKLKKLKTTVAQRNYK